jgi:hypothetical protein
MIKRVQKPLSPKLKRILKAAKQKKTENQIGRG